MRGSASPDPGVRRDLALESEELNPSTQDQMDGEMVPATPATMNDEEYTSTDSQTGSNNYSVRQVNEWTAPTRSHDITRDSKLCSQPLIFIVLSENFSLKVERDEFIK